MPLGWRLLLKVCRSSVRFSQALKALHRQGEAFVHSGAQQSLSTLPRDPGLCAAWLGGVPGVKKKKLELHTLEHQVHLWHARLPFSHPVGTEQSNVGEVETQSCLKVLLSL